jgi:aspartate carbamoyltransferase catalytic subunit
MRHFLDWEDLTLDEWQGLYRRFEDILASPRDFMHAAHGRSLATLFYEPSTRTRFSFEAAMQRLGGGVFGFSDPGASSVKKGETLKDTTIMVSGYADAIVLRHPREGAALASSLYSRVPVINAGDGGHLHPTQTLTDLAAITKLRGTPNGLSIGVCGDLKHGRTAHSLLRALKRFPGVKLYLIAPRALAIPDYVRDWIAGMPYAESASLDAAIPKLDVLYMTRIQRERFADPREYQKLRGMYILTPGKLKRAKKDLLVLHPLPRVDEISPEVDDDPRAGYFEQARLGMYIRMALLLALFDVGATVPSRPSLYWPHVQHPAGSRVCINPACVTADEPLPPLRKGERCAYCEGKAAV